MAYNNITTGQISKAKRKNRINRKNAEKQKQIWKKNNKQ